MAAAGRSAFPARIAKTGLCAKLKVVDVIRETGQARLFMNMKRRIEEIIRKDWEISPVIIWVPFGILLLSALLLGCVVKLVPPGPRHVVVVHPAPVGPPHIGVAVRPRLVFVAQYGLYSAPDLEVDLYFYDGAWIYFYGDVWYRSSSYEGPWKVVQGKHLPPGLAKAPPGQIKRIAKGLKKGHKARGRGGR